MRILAVDPGGTTGFALWEYERMKAWADPDPHGSAMTVWARLGSYKVVDVLVMESFHISAQTHRKTQAGSLTAIELIGVGRHLSEFYKRRFVMQTPTEAKGFSTDKKLKAMNWWTPGSDHARDATRHLLLFLSKERLIDLKQLIR